MNGQTKSNAESMDAKLVGIRGWLLLPAIGFSLGTVYDAISLIGLLEIHSKAVYLYWLEIIVFFALLVFKIYAAILFFGKRSSAPPIIIGYLGIKIIVLSLMNLIETFAGINLFVDYATLAGAAGAAAIWISYFEKSKRVKATFTK